MSADTKPQKVLPIGNVGMRAGGCDDHGGYSGHISSFNRAGALITLDAEDGERRGQENIFVEWEKVELVGAAPDLTGFDGEPYDMLWAAGDPTSPTDYRPHYVLVTERGDKDAPIALISVPHDPRSGASSEDWQNMVGGALAVAKDPANIHMLDSEYTVTDLRPYGGQFPYPSWLPALPLWQVCGGDDGEVNDEVPAQFCRPKPKPNPTPQHPNGTILSSFSGGNYIFTACAIPGPEAWMVNDRSGDEGEFGVYTARQARIMANALQEAAMICDQKNGVAEDVDYGRQEDDRDWSAVTAGEGEIFVAVSQFVLSDPIGVVLLQRPGQFDLPLCVIVPTGDKIDLEDLLNTAELIRSNTNVIGHGLPYSTGTPVNVIDLRPYLDGRGSIRIPQWVFGLALMPLREGGEVEMNEGGPYYLNPPCPWMATEAGAIGMTISVKHQNEAARTADAA